MRRLEVHQSTLAAAKAKLLALMRDTPPDELEQLLHSTFAYIGLVPLRDIFLAIVGRQVPMDGHQLDGIAADPELFSELPIGVQRQVPVGGTPSMYSGMSLSFTSEEASTCLVLHRITGASWMGLRPTLRCSQSCPSACSAMYWLVGGLRCTVHCSSRLLSHA